MSEVADVPGLLVVDDDPSFLSFACETLDRVSIRHSVAVTGRHAIEHLRRARYGGVLLDLRLPDMDGLEVLRDLRQRADGTPVVVLTGAATVPMTIEVMRWNVWAFLEKPITSGELAAAASSMLSPIVLGTPTRRFTGGALDQLGEAMIAVVRSPDDIPSVRKWCRLVGRSESSLYSLCSAVAVNAKAALDLARLIRLAGLHVGLRPRYVIDAADPRTAARFLKRTGLSADVLASQPVDYILRNQRIVVNHPVVDLLLTFIGGTAPKGGDGIRL